MKSFLILIFFGAVVASNAPITPIADTYLDQCQPTINFGLSQTAYIARDEQYPYCYLDLLVMLNISVVPSNFTNLVCYHTQTGVNEDEINGPTIPLDAYSVACNWTETAVTYSSSPALGTKFLDGYVDDNDNVVIVPMTTAVQLAKLGGHTTFCYIVRSPNVIKPFIVYTNQALLQNRPYCEVQY
jgi:hypothetical protein